MTNTSHTITSVEITGAETSLSLQRKYLTLDGIDAILREVSMERVLTGESENTYSKVFFRIETAGGESYNGRVDVRNEGTEQEIGGTELSIRKHIQQHLDYVRKTDDREEEVVFWEKVISQNA